MQIYRYLEYFNKKKYEGEDNRTIESPVSLLNLSESHWILCTNANMKGIPYIPLCTTSFISNNYTNPLTDQAFLLLNYSLVTGMLTMASEQQLHLYRKSLWEDKNRPIYIIRK
ncbi:hypothetical protein H8356DRAFT_1423576 [Neocallimastix lanati (nom. inval.)]|nr:hypothetical protein H8356DRAFT_1423576 [Neocallimastix sp. JGI-2020a]